MATTLRSEFRPLPPQSAFLQSKAKVRGFGGAMGGGKSRTLCEDKFNEMLDFPGITVVLAREAHTSIVETTRKTMLGVIPAELIARIKASAGEDFIQLWNGSTCHFIGLDNPYRWYSAEIGSFGADEAQEIEEEKIVRLLTRLRQPGMPHRACFTFNPSSPGHWLQQWFLLGGEQTRFGFRKDELFMSDAIAPFGDCEFFFALAKDNIYLPDGYIENTLGGMPERLRRRYLDGLWEFTEGFGFFDADALAGYEKEIRTPLMVAKTCGDPDQDFMARSRRKRTDDPVRFKPGSGNWSIWKKPVKGHRYVMAVDVSSGGSYDYSAIQIVEVEAFEQVAEFQGKLTPTDLALEAYRAGRVFNNALAVPEITGGWGFTIEQELKRLHYPALYTRRILDRLSKKWTDKTGWDTTSRTRAHMLDTLERVLRERELVLNSTRSLVELATFVYSVKGKPEAQQGCNDDLVIALAIAVTVALDLPRELRKVTQPRYEPRFQATGY